MSASYKETDTLLKLENVSKQYDNTPILYDVNLEVKDVVRPEISQGQVCAIVGRSGLGKTTLFKVMAGLEKPTTGTIKVGVDQHEVCPGNVSIVPQNYILFNHRTVYHNLKIGLLNCGMKLTESEMKEKIEDYAGKFDVVDHLHKYPAQLSGGQKQRISILQQVLTDNKFILLDEPFSGLDIFVLDKVINLLLKISVMNELNTIVIVSHDIPTSMAIADLVWVMARKKDVPGATIIKTIDLKTMGLAWQPDIKKNPKFQELVHDVKAIM